MTVLTGDRLLEHGEDGRAFFHDLRFLFRRLLLPDNSIMKVHQGNGFVFGSLLQLRYGGLFGAIVYDPVHHVVIVLDRHLRRFQRIIRRKVRQLLEPEPVNVEISYRAALIERNDVAGRQ